jgi:hypothetical protein
MGLTSITKHIIKCDTEGCKSILQAINISKALRVNGWEEKNKGKALEKKYYCPKCAEKRKQKRKIIPTLLQPDWDARILQLADDELDIHTCQHCGSPYRRLHRCMFCNSYDPDGDDE